ncbi:hypothetical protein MMC22_002768 [Lobaria immixta]|nr:hypothetical protein [Lobaria immixta]
MDTTIAPLLVEGAISSSLVPVSKSHAFTFPDRPRDRIVPESPANQSSGQPGSSLDADKDNEMLAVQSRYTACVERQHLPGSTQELYPLVARLAGFASEYDLNPFTREDASDAVRCIDHYVMEAASDLNAEASSGDLPRPQTPFMDSLGDGVATLVANGLTGLDLGLALFASRTHAQRNSIFHGKTYDLSKSENFAELAEWVDLNENTIERLLPNLEKPRAGMYRRLICFTRDYRICKNDDGKWVKRQSPLPEEVPHQFVPRESALRSSMEMGRLRPAGLDGPIHFLFLSVPQPPAGIPSRNPEALSGLLRRSRLVNLG